MNTKRFFSFRRLPSLRVLGMTCSMGIVATTACCPNPRAGASSSTPADERSPAHPGVDKSDSTAPSSAEPAGREQSVSDGAEERSALEEGGAKYGVLGKDEIRNVVRSHIEEVRACYNEGLVTDPELQGRVAINFVISEIRKQILIRLR